jgi:hypothetical protein
MNHLWQRFRRLCGQSRIRLAAVDVGPAALRPGDRLEIGPRTWRLESVGSREVVLACGERRARLFWEPGAAGTPWLLADGDTRVRLGSRDLLHFPL